MFTSAIPINGKVSKKMEGGSVGSADEGGGEERRGEERRGEDRRGERGENYTCRDIHALNVCVCVE